MYTKIKTPYFWKRKPRPWLNDMKMDSRKWGELISLTVLGLQLKWEMNSTELEDAETIFRFIGC